LKRRRFLRLGAGTLAAGATIGLYSWQVEPFRLEFVRKNMPITGLPDSLNGKTLMQISDMHVGNRFDRQFLIDSMTKASEYNPDIVVYTGDFVSYENSSQFDQLEKVMAHATKGSLGTVGVLGNHDYGHGWSQELVASRVVDILDEAGVRILRNTKKNLGGLEVIGIDDYWSPNFNPQEAMKKWDASAPSICLCHNPDACDLDIWSGYKGWILSGHTHGGQVKPPFLPPPILPVKNKRYTCGEFDFEDGRKLYINRALGHLWQIRMNVRPEITLFTLKQA